MFDNERSDVTLNSLGIPLFSSPVTVMDLYNSVLKAYRKVFTVLGEAYTIRGTGLYGGSVYRLFKPLTL